MNGAPGRMGRDFPHLFEMWGTRLSDIKVSINNKNILTFTSFSVSSGCWKEVLMRPENEAKLRKIRRISVILRVMCKALLALIVIGYLMATVALVANRGGSVGYFDVWFRVRDLT